MSTEVTTAQMNRAICEFMGWEFKPDGEDWYKAYHDGDLMWADTGYGLEQIFLKGFKYHEDWNKLMPVVEKIEKDYCNIIELVMYSSSCCINKWNPHTGKYDSFIHETGNKRDAVYKAVYQFITWLNQQKQTNE